MIIIKVYLLKIKAYFTNVVIHMNTKQIFKENELDELKDIIEKEKTKWKTIVWTNGCFDILHPGHLKTFEIAKLIEKDNAIGTIRNNIVVVWLNWDKSPYWKTKPGRPINDEDFRSKMLRWLKNINYVYIFNTENAVNPVNVLRPDIVLKWGNYYPTKISDNLIKWLPEDKRYKIKKLNDLIERLTSKNWIVDITWVYEYILSSGLDKPPLKEFLLIPEWLINVKNWWKIVLVPLLEGYSTTNIVEKIRPKEFLKLIILWEGNKDRFKNLEEFLLWYLSNVDK